MQLEFLAELELVYRDEPAIGGIYVLVQPYGGEEGTAYGELDGTVSGERLRGSVRCVNHPHRRSDGVMLPHVHGLIRTVDGAAVMVALHGRTVIREATGVQLLTATFEAEDARYQWLNSAVCVVEGVISEVSMQARIYRCINELG